MKRKILYVIFISILSINAFGQKRVYPIDFSKEITQKIGISLKASRAGFVYYDKSSHNLIPYLVLVFKNNQTIQKRRRTGELKFEIERNGSKVGSNMKWDETLDPGVKDLTYIIYDVDCRDVSDEDFSGYTFKCWFESKEGKKLDIGEFTVKNINYNLTYRHDFVYYDGRFFLPKTLDINDL